jgi:hypothetical protein
VKTADIRETRKADRAMPTRSLLLGCNYEPSWKQQGRQRTTWTDRLGGHYGIVDTHAALRRRPE